MSTDSAWNAARVWGVCLLLGAATFATFWPVVHADFITHDDPSYVTENAHVASGLTWTNIRWAFTATHSSNWHPLTWISHMLDVELFGLAPGWHHLTSLLLHTTNTVLLFLLFWQMTGALGRSALLAALFALHPLHVESVAWISERKDVLSTCFGLLSLIAYARFARSAVRRPFFYALALGLLALGLMSKPMLVTWPAVMLLLDYWPLGSVAQGRARSWSQRAVEKIPFFGLSLASCVVTYMAQAQNRSVASLEGLPLGLRATNAISAYGTYLGKTIWPSDLSIFYPHPAAATTDSALPASLWWSLTLLAAISVLVLLSRRRRFLVTGWLWFLGTLVPVIGIVQVGNQSMADRYTYIPLIGIFVMGVWGVHALLVGRHAPRWTMATLGGATLLPLLWSSAQQVPVWDDTQTVFSHALALDARSALAHYNLALDAIARGQMESAIAHLDSALAIEPRYADAAYSMGFVLAAQGKADLAIAQYEAALQLQPDHVMANNNLGLLLWERGEMENAERHFSHALAIDPERSEAHHNLGLVRLNQHRLNEAATHFTAAIRAKRDYGIAIDSLGRVQLAQGQPDAALQTFQQALATHPDTALVHLHTSQALARLERWREARTEIDTAQQVDPPSPWVLNDLAWILATHARPEMRDGPLAVTLATRACELSNYTQALLVGTLAAALAEAGRFDAAVQSATMAKQLADTTGRPDLAQRNTELLELYRGGQPYHEAAE